MLRYLDVSYTGANRWTIENHTSNCSLMWKKSTCSYTDWCCSQSWATLCCQIHFKPTHTHTHMCSSTETISCSILLYEPLPLESATLFRETSGAWLKNNIRAKTMSCGSFLLCWGGVGGGVYINGCCLRHPSSLHHHLCHLQRTNEIWWNSSSFANKQEEGEMDHPTKGVLLKRRWRQVISAYQLNPKH